MGGHTRRFNPSHQWIHKRILAGELKVLQMDVQTYFFRRTNMNALGQPRSWTDHLLWHHACHTVDLFQYQTGEQASQCYALQGPMHPTLGIAMDMSIGLKVPSGAICTLSLSFNNDGPFGTFFRYICDNGTYIARYDDLFDGKNNSPIDVSKVDVSMNGIELQDREFFAAIRQRREPNASVAQCLTAMQTLAKLEDAAFKARQGIGELMIIDCHGHYTTAPGELNNFRDAQLAALKGPGAAALEVPRISDDAIRDSLEKAQLKLQRERGTDLTIFSPRASAMGHHLGNEATSLQWARVCNDLIHRVCRLYPDNFVGVCQLPQSPGVPPANSAAELERCVRELGFIGCNLNPGPVGRPLEFPAADRPALVSALREDGRARRAGHGARQRLVQSQLPCHRRALHQRRHHRVHAVPDLRSVQGLSDAALHHPARRRRRAVSLGPFSRAGAGPQAPAARRCCSRTSFSTPASTTCRASSCCSRWCRTENILFGSEMVGAVRGIDPRTGALLRRHQALCRCARAQRGRPAARLLGECAPGFSAPGCAAEENGPLGLALRRHQRPSQTEAGTSTSPRISARAVRRMPERPTVKLSPAPDTSSVTVNSPLGCSTDITRGESCGILAMPSATEPGMTQAVATLTAPSTPIALWQRCGMKLRVHTWPPARRRRSAPSWAPPCG